MRIRLPVAGAFLVLLLIAAYAGLTSIQLGQYVNDKVLHFITFFILTVVFYWIVDTNRRRVMNMTLVACTIVLGVGSEFVQSFLDNGREFDLYDIVANLMGSLLGVGLCSWYHKLASRSRTLEEEVDNWDENQIDDDWDEEEAHDVPANTHTLDDSADIGDLADSKKRMD
ncbi:hypothetical protein FG05_06292 [Fusarium graminearum]|nr:hypothetical protein FG05_06292 [Fusarium graminearum]